MILGQVSILDCIVFLVFLAPQLMIHVGIWRTVTWLLGALPTLGSWHSIIYLNRPFMFTGVQVLLLPYQFARERYFTPYESRSPFVQRATVFQDVVIRCVRFAFASMPAFLGRVFFSKAVALPFLRFRMLRHGFVTSPIRWTEIDRVWTPLNGGDICRGLLYLARSSWHMDHKQPVRAARYHRVLLPWWWFFHGIVLLLLGVPTCMG
jgi:hypothetical protein